MNPDLLADIICRVIHFTNQNLYLTGKAGTGKTSLLKRIAEDTHKRFAIVAPTGVAAIQAGGVTIHSFFGIHPHTFIPWGQVPESSSFQIESAYTLNRNLRLNQEKINLIQNLDLLIIDEISMVRSDLLDAVDTVLRKYRDPQKPFGGIQLFMIGDLFQLPPVVKDEESKILSAYYPGFYFFESQALKKANFIKIELEHVYRQVDHKFLTILNQIRFGLLSDVILNELSKHIKPNIIHENEAETIILTTHVRKADEINRNKIDNLTGQERVFQAEITGEFQPGSYPTDVSLRLKKGAQVMFIKNDKEKRFFNGKLGRIIGWDDDNEELYIQCAGEEDVIAISQEKWRQIKYTFNPQNNSVQEDEKGAFSQFPIRLAWAVTIHKSQGLTFDQVIIDASSAFVPGQIYVAMSRCRTLEGITLTQALSKRELLPDSQIIQFSKTFDDAEIIVQELVSMELNQVYLRSQKAFDLQWLKSNIREMQELLIPHLKKLSPGLKDQIKLLEEVNTSIVLISNSYKPRLDRLFHQLNEGVFPEEESNRLPKGVNYFILELINKIGVPIQQIIWELHKEKGTKAILSQLRIFDIRIKASIRLLLEVEYLYHAWLNRSEVNSIKTALNQGLTDVYHKIKYTDNTLSDEKIKKSTKKQIKGSTQKITLDLFRSGINVFDIAFQRELKSSTIAKHLEEYLISGEIKIQDLLDEIRLNEIKMAIRTFPEDTKAGEIIKTLQEHFEAHEIKWTLVYERNLKSNVE
jgi:hypothetical protein